MCCCWGWRVRRRWHRLYFTRLCLWNRLRGEFPLKILPLRQSKLVTFFLFRRFQDCGDREGQSSPSASLCVQCDSGASRRHLEDDLSSDPCVCMPAWSMSKAEPNCANQQGCPTSACDNDPIGPWCEVVNRGCATAEGDGSWAYCSPGTTMVPSEFYEMR